MRRQRALVLWQRIGTGGFRPTSRKVLRRDIESDNNPFARKCCPGFMPGMTVVRTDPRKSLRKRKSGSALPKCARNTVRLAGHNCISVQNIHVHKSLVDRFTKVMRAATE